MTDQQSGAVEQVAGDIFDLHDKNPDFRSDDVWWMKYWPLTLALMTFLAIVTLPFSALARLLGVFVEHEYLQIVSATPTVCVGLGVAAVMGDLLSDFNEAFEDIPGKKDGITEFYHCDDCEEFPTPLNVANRPSKVGAVGQCEHCDSLLWARNHHIRVADREEFDYER